MDELLACVIDARQPMRPILEKLSKSTSSEKGFKRAYAELHANRDISTLYGNIVQKLEVVGPTGSLHMEYISPMALLIHASATSLGFFRLMQACVSQAPGQVLRFVFYHDGVTPGNNLRPDNGRSFVSFLWSVLELPRFLRNRSRMRWFTYSYVLKKDMKSANISIANIARAILLDLFRDTDRNFETTGILLRHGEETQVLRMSFTTCPQDWLAHVDMYNLKGQAGLNPCPLCDNCMGRRAFFEDNSGFSHVLSPVYEKFIVRDSARMQEVIDSIEKVAVDGTPDELDDIEKSIGIKYDRNGLLFDKGTACIIDLSSAIYADTAHCLLASGGVGQYHINQFVLRIINNTDCTLADLDSFTTKVTLPRGWSKLTKTFFRDRVVHKESSHLRAFASEVLLAVDILGLFVEMVLEPAGVLSAEIKCFKYLQELLDHICKGTCEHAHPALDACRKHHQCFLSLYALCATPKLHYTWHAIMSWIKCGVLVSCLGAEAEHKQPKRVMQYAYKNCTKTAMSHWLRGFMGHLDDPTTFAPTHLPLDAKQCDYTVTIGVHVAKILRHALQVATPVGTFYKGDLLHWSAQAHCVGIAKCFLMASIGGDVKFIAVVQQYLQVSAELWQASEFACVSTTVVTCALPFVKDGDNLRPMSFGH